MDETGTIERRTVAELAAKRLREKILRGEYVEGEPLRQDALAAALGVSRIPVREALRQLEAEGLVSFQAHHGAVVSTLSIEEIDELFELRALLEAELLRRAVPRLTEHELSRATEALDAYDRSLAAGEVADWGALNWRFHSALLAAAGRPLSLGVVQTLHNQSERYMRMQLALTHGETTAADEHRAILAAARARDAEGAARLLSAHVLAAGGALSVFLSEHRERRAAAAERGRGR